MVSLIVAKPEEAGQPDWRRYSLTYERALTVARENVTREANDRGDDLSEEDLELRTAKRAALYVRQSF